MAKSAKCSRCGKRPRRAEDQRYCTKCQAESQRQYRKRTAQRLAALKRENEQLRRERGEASHAAVEA